LTQPLAVFDLDYTLIEADCELLWCDYLHDLGIVDEHYMHKIHRFDLDYIEGHLDYHEFDRALLAPLQPFSAAKAAQLRQEYLPLLQPCIRPWMMEVVEQQRSAGRRVVLATASNSFLAEAIASMLGFTDLVCTRVNAKGEIDGEAAFREGKVRNLQQYINGEGIVFEDCWAYSDSHNDIPLLSLVGHPVAVTPDPVLRVHAVRCGWDVLKYTNGHSKS
jgi:HAD superfamily hydrolase (TIGR01490 family)